VSSAIDEHVNEPRLLDLVSEPVFKIACGADHTLLLCLGAIRNLYFLLLLLLFVCLYLRRIILLFLSLGNNGETLLYGVGDGTLIYFVFISLSISIDFFLIYDRLERSTWHGYRERLVHSPGN
jgi:hypothetical protein